MKKIKKNSIGKLLNKSALDFFFTTGISLAITVSLTGPAFSDVPFPDANTLGTGVTTQSDVDTFQIRHSGANGAVFKNDWNSFNVPLNKTVDFNFSNAGQISVNRIVGGSESQILGHITQSGAGGSVFLLNPNGVLFGSGSTVNVNSFLVSTHTMSDANLTKLVNDKQLILSRGETTQKGILIDTGAQITAPDGISVSSNAIFNKGGIFTATNGNLQFITGDGVTFNFDANNKAQLVANADITGTTADTVTMSDASTLKSGEIRNNNGTITANNVKLESKINKIINDPTDYIVNTDTAISANKVASSGGDIIIYASNDQQDSGPGSTNVNIRATLSAQNNIDIEADNINLTNSTLSSTDNTIALKGTTINLTGTNLSTGLGTLSMKYDGSTGGISTLLKDSTIINSRLLKIYTFNSNLDIDRALNGTAGNILFTNLYLSAEDDLNINNPLNAAGHIYIIAGNMEGIGTNSLAYYADVTDGTLVNGLGGSAGFGENILPGNDDESTGFIDLTSIFPSGLNYYGTVFTGLYLNNNGNLTFGNLSSSYTPTAINGGENIIAGYYTDIETTAGAKTPSPGGNSTGTNLVYWDVDTAHNTFTATWDDVGEYGVPTAGPCAFQISIVKRSSSKFDIVLRYENIADDWTSHQDARAGYSSNNGVNFFELPQSGNYSQMSNLENIIGNTNKPGLWVFTADGGEMNGAVGKVNINSTITAGNGVTVQNVTEGLNVNQTVINKLVANNISFESPHLTTDAINYSGDLSLISDSFTANGNINSTGTVKLSTQNNNVSFSDSGLLDEYAKIQSGASKVELGSDTYTGDVSISGLNVLNPVVINTSGFVNLSNLLGNGTISVDRLDNGIFDSTESSSVTLAGGNMTLKNIFSQGNIDANSTGYIATTAGNIISSQNILFRAINNLTIGNGSSISALGTGNSLVLSTTNGHFLNNSNASALIASSGRWLVYSDNPTNTVLGGLSASKIYNKRYAVNAPSTIASGNHFLYSVAPTITVTADSLSKTYGSANPTFTASVTGLQYGDSLESAVTGNYLFSTAATESSTVAGGPYTINVAQGPAISPMGYQFSFAPGSLTVNKAPLTVTAVDKTKVYGQVNPAFTASYSDFVLGQNSSVLGGSLAFDAGDATQSSNVGSYNITPSGLTSDNYDITFAPGHLDITKAPLTVTAVDKTKVYGQVNPAFTASYSDFVLGQNSSVLGGSLAFDAGDATQSSNVGSYNITPSGLTSGNYDITFAPGHLDITKAPLTVTAADKTKVYGQLNSTFTASYDGFVLDHDSSELGGSLAFATDATQSSNVGTYTITPSGLTSGNYEIAFNPGHLDITKAPLTVTAVDKTKVYGQVNPAFTASYSGFVLNQDYSDLCGTLAFDAGGATQSSNVGTYTIIPGGLTSGNYQITYNPGHLDITKAPLTVRAADSEKYSSDENPAFSSIYAGFVLNQDSSVLGGNLVYNTSATSSSSAGRYIVTPSGLTSGNYSITYEDGTLNIKNRVAANLERISEAIAEVDPSLSDEKHTIEILHNTTPPPPPVQNPSPHSPINTPNPTVDHPSTDNTSNSNVFINNNDGHAPVNNGNAGSGSSDNNNSSSGHPGNNYPANAGNIPINNNPTIPSFGQNAPNSNDADSGRQQRVSGGGLLNMILRNFSN